MAFGRACTSFLEDKLAEQEDDFDLADGSKFTKFVAASLDIVRAVMAMPTLTVQSVVEHAEEVQGLKVAAEKSSNTLRGAVGQ
eukprot:4948317-Pyramimonas_sp.AAC.1